MLRASSRTPVRPHVVVEDLAHVESGREDRPLAGEHQGPHRGVLLADVDERGDLAERLDVQCVDLVAGQRQHGDAVRTRRSRSWRTLRWGSWCGQATREPVERSPGDPARSVVMSRSAKRHRPSALANRSMYWPDRTTAIGPSAVGPQDRPVAPGRGRVAAGPDQETRLVTRCRVRTPRWRPPAFVHGPHLGRPRRTCRSVRAPGGVLEQGGAPRRRPRRRPGTVPVDRAAISDSSDIATPDPEGGRHRRSRTRRRGRRDSSGTRAGSRPDRGRTRSSPWSGGHPPVRPDPRSTSAPASSRSSAELFGRPLPHQAEVATGCGGRRSAELESARAAVRAGGS